MCMSRVRLRETGSQGGREIRGDNKLYNFFKTSARKSQRPVSMYMYGMSSVCRGWDSRYLKTPPLYRVSRHERRTRAKRHRCPLPGGRRRSRCPGACGHGTDTSTGSCMQNRARCLAPGRSPPLPSALGRPEGQPGSPTGRLAPRSALPPGVCVVPRGASSRLFTPPTRRRRPCRRRRARGCRRPRRCRRPRGCRRGVALLLLLVLLRGARRRRAAHCGLRSPASAPGPRGESGRECALVPCTPSAAWVQGPSVCDRLQRHLGVCARSVAVQDRARSSTSTPIRLSWERRLSAWK